MDAVILAGVGGYATRAEFIVDAIQERVLELSIDVVEDAGAPAPAGPAPATVVTPALAAALKVSQDLIVAPTVPMTAIRVPVETSVLEGADDLSHPGGHALFGLHNRDYPTLWTLALLAKLTGEGPMPIESFYTEALREAWSFGELLLAVEKHLDIKCTAVFPTNPEKRKPAEAGFRSFALGDYRRVGDAYTTSGPLFEWRVAGLIEGETSEPLIGVTAVGWQLLQAVAGVSVEQPHPAVAATYFLTHLAEHSPADHRGFVEVMSAIGQSGATRQDVLSHVAHAWPDWTENEVSTNSAGYVARAREWGLIEPKQVKTRYYLTPFGNGHLATSTDGAQS